MVVLPQRCDLAMPGAGIMTASLSQFTSDRRCWLLVLAVVLAAVLGFHTFSDSVALTLVSKAGFWIVLSTFLIWLRGLWQTFAPDIKRLTWRSVDWTSMLVVVA